MHISDFDYDLPEELIAQHPLAKRDASRMLVLDRAAQTWRDSLFSQFPSYLRAHDVVVLNNTRVFGARLTGKRIPTGGNVELLLLREVETNLWEALCKPSRRLKAGDRISFGGVAFQGEISGTLGEGRRLIRFAATTGVSDLIDKFGQPPLPPYIKRPLGSIDDDLERYQTIYAKHHGAVAAPTAGLHFSTQTLDEIRTRTVAITEITLHVGYGTFEPVHVTDVTQHRVKPEQFSISEEAASIINRRTDFKGRLVAVGTTTTRALESSVSRDGFILPSPLRETDVTITPGYKFAAVDVLLTNFHLPKSSLLMLVSAFAGREFVLAAYNHAVSERYRFYSYGDCMLIV
jgi:S-adenosylmethionine:tRNA ribosyltransferase-isomerase